MKIELPEDYAKSRVTSHVHALLYQLHQQFTCGLKWIKRTKHPFGSDQVIMAEPLRDHPWLRYLTLGATGDAGLGEYSWQVSSELPPMQRGPVGWVNLEASVHASIGITNGTTAYLSDDGSRPGFLCWAEPYILQGDHTIYRLQTDAGVLWLWPQQTNKSLSGLLYGQEPPSGASAIVIHLAETSFYSPQLSHYMGVGPWSGFSTRDESGRQWRIEESRLEFGVRLGLRVTRYNDRLNNRRITTLQPPYDAVWQPDGQHGFGLPLRLAVPKS